MLGTIASAALRAYSAPRAKRFATALESVDKSQRSVLKRIIRDSVSTAYAQSLGLRSDDDLDAFRAKVPIASYESFEPWIRSQREGRVNAISPGPVRCYEGTSGSTGASKHIPYNDALLKSFRGLFAIWVHDLLTHQLKLRSARVFMSVSPPDPDREGFADDSEYLGGTLKTIVGRFIVTPPTSRNPETFRDDLICALIEAHDLEFVSIWNPSYLLILLEHFQANRDRLMDRISPNRRYVLNDNQMRWETVWPDLQMISCWTSAAAGDAARLLARQLPHARIQGKGLLATEAPMTVPLVNARGCVPLVDEVFFELMSEDGEVVTLENAHENTEYEVIVTQAGGFLRYRIGDRVRVTGHYRDAPLLEFIGRVDSVSDLVGEKLNEVFVDAAFSETVSRNAFRTLVPVVSANTRPRYCVFTDDSMPELQSRIETALLQAFRYREARALGQLDPIEIVVQGDMRRLVHDALTAQGIRAADIKDRALFTSRDTAKRIYAEVTQRIPA